MIRNAFVKVVRSELEHNKGDLFYKVFGFDTDIEQQTDVAHCTEYPFMWGFRDIKHALAIADVCNDPNADVMIGALIRRFADDERDAHDKLCEERWRAHDAQDMETA